MATLASYAPGDTVTGFTRSSTSYNEVFVAPTADLQGTGSDENWTTYAGTLDALVPAELAGAGSDEDWTTYAGVLDAREPAYAVLTTYIGGVKVPVVEPRSPNIELNLGQRSVYRLTINDEGPQFHLSYGEEVIVNDPDGDRVFGGVVIAAEEEWLAPGLLQHRVSAIDWTYLLDKRSITKAFENELAGDIVRWIVTNILEEEGILLADATIEDGPTVAAARWSGVPVRQALDELSEQTGMWCDVDAYKALTFVDRATVTAPFAITGDDDFKQRNPAPKLYRASPKYQNVSEVHGGFALTAQRSEEFAGDGKRRTFTVSYPVAQVPTVQLNGVAQTVGIQGVDDVGGNTKDFYWNKGSKEIVQDNGGTVLNTGDTLAVDYIGQYPSITRYVDDAAVAAQAAVDGTSGKVEKVIDVPNSTGRSEQVSAAVAAVEQHVQHGRRFTFVTHKKGLAPGQLLTVTFDDFGLAADEMLVENVTITCSETALWYAVTAILGPLTGNWVKVFQDIARAKRTAAELINVGESEVVVVLRQHEDTWTWSEIVTITPVACPVPSETLYPSETLFPC